MKAPYSSDHFATLEAMVTSSPDKSVPKEEVIKIIKKAGVVAIYAEVLEELSIEAGITDDQIISKIVEFKKRSDREIKEYKNKEGLN